MPELLELEVATPERMLVKEQVEEVQIPARSGYLGVLPGHAPLLAELANGYLYFSVGSRKRYLAILGGFVEINDNHVRVLADAAERAEDIDLERARTELRQAQENLANQSLGLDPATALGAVEKAQARVDAATHK